MTHPNVYSEFATENHFIQNCSGKLFSQVSTDMANRSMICRLKVKWRKNWQITEPVRVSSSSEGHVQATRRVERDEKDVKKMKVCFSSGLVIDPFIHDSDALLIFPTGVVLPYFIWSEALFCKPYQTFSLSAFFLPFISVVKAV